MKRRPVDLADVYAERLGSSPRGVQGEWSPGSSTCRGSCCAAAIPAGKAGAVSAEAATAHGDLWVLAGFLADARTAMTVGGKR